MRLTRRRMYIVLGSVVAALIVLTAVLTVPQKVIVTNFNLDAVYVPGASTGGCFPPAHQALPDSFSVSPGTIIKENFTLTDIIANVKCTFTALNLTTAGFGLLSSSPSLPWSFSDSSHITVSLTIKTPNTGYNGPVSIELDGNATVRS